MVDPAAAAAESCPKCGTPRRGERACARCGLSAHRMEAYAKTLDASVPAAVAAAWDRVLESWEELPRHDALLQLAAQHGAYVWAAARYREAKRGRPASPSPFRTYPDHAIDAIADRQLDRMRRAAEATMFASAATRDGRRASTYRTAISMLVMLVIAIVAGTIIASMARSDPADSGDATPAPPPAARPAADAK